VGRPAWIAGRSTPRSLRDFAVAGGVLRIAALRMVQFPTDIRLHHYRVRLIQMRTQPAAYERARAVDPTFESSVAPSLAVTLGDLPKAAQLQERIVMRDPVDKNPYLKLAYIYIRQGRLSEAEAAVRKAKELSPTGVGIPITLGEILVRRGEAQAGLAEIEQDPDETNRVWKSAWAYQYLGRKHDADVALGRLIAMDAGPSGLALLYAMRGERDVAFDWLERAYNQHDDRLLYILDHNPDMKNLREDPRWKAFLKKMNLSEG
jgi:tetratricopeptide (TPR) repeat protein